MNMIVIEVRNLSTKFGQSFLLLLGQDSGQESWAFLGEDSMAWIVFALGAAMVVGNVLAILKPPAEQETKAPLGRTIVMISIGALAALWAVASLLG